METATRNLDIVTRVKGLDKAQDDFKKLKDTTDDLSDTTKNLSSSVIGSTDDITEYGEIVAEASIITSKWGEAIVLTSGFLTAGLALGALMVVIPLVMDYAKEMKAAKEWTELMAGAVEKATSNLFKSQSAFKGFEMPTEEELRKNIEVLRGMVKEYENLTTKRSNEAILDNQMIDATKKGLLLKTDIQERLTEAEKADKLLNEEILKTHKETLAQLLAQEQVLKKMKELGYKPATEKVPEEIDRFMSMEFYLRKLDEAKRKEELIESKNRIFRHTIGYEFNLKDQPVKPQLTITKDEIENSSKLYADLFKDAADVMRSEFGSAWESIFGEANSLFEKLIASWASTLFTKLGNNLIGDLLGFIPGGSIISSILGLGKASPGR